MIGERIYDPLELGEASVERWADENIRGDEFRCAGCRKWFPLDQGVPASPSPFALPICWDCAGFPDEPAGGQ